MLRKEASRIKKWGIKVFHSIQEILHPGIISSSVQNINYIDQKAIQDVIYFLQRAYDSQAHVFLAGNGGSASTASHIATDLAKTIRGVPVNQSLAGFRAISLTDNAGLMTAWANDDSYDSIFVEQLKGLAHSNDVLMVISGSGNSSNIIAAVKAARDMGLQVVGFLGMEGGQLRELVDVAVIVPSNDYGIIEDTHLALGHLLTRFFKQWLSQDFPHSGDLNPISRDGHRVEG